MGGIHRGQQRRSDISVGLACTVELDRHAGKGAWKWTGGYCEWDLRGDDFCAESREADEGLTKDIDVVSGGGVSQGGRVIVVAATIILRPLLAKLFNSPSLALAIGALTVPVDDSIGIRSISR